MQIPMGLNEEQLWLLRPLLLCGNAKLRNYLKTWLHFSAAFNFLPSLLTCTGDEFSKFLRWKRTECQAHFSLSLFYLECWSLKSWFPWKPQIHFSSSFVFAKRSVDFSDLITALCPVSLLLTRRIDKYPEGKSCLLVHLSVLPFSEVLLPQVPVVFGTSQMPPRNGLFWLTSVGASIRNKIIHHSRPVEAWKSSILVHQGKSTSPFALVPQMLVVFISFKRRLLQT